jgi:hypothetical protein
MWISRWIWDVSTTPSGIKREWYVCYTTSIKHRMLLKRYIPNIDLNKNSQSTVFRIPANVFNHLNYIRMPLNLQSDITEQYLSIRSTRVV